MIFFKMFLNNYRRKFPLVNPLVIKKYFYRHVYSASKSVGNDFFYEQRIYRRTKNYQQKIHQRRISIGDFVGKLIINVICVLRRQKNSVGKTVKSCSVNLSKIYGPHKICVCILY